MIWVKGYRLQENCLAYSEVKYLESWGSMGLGSKTVPLQKTMPSIGSEDQIYHWTWPNVGSKYLARMLDKQMRLHQLFEEAGIFR